jgi:hypothetical protein
LKFIAMALGAAFVAAGLAACGGTVPDRIAAAKATTRATKPLVEWVEPLPEHLADVDPGRLKGEGAALIVVRTYRESTAGERNGASHFVLLRDVSTSTIVSNDVQRTGTDAEVGWALLLVPPGQYALNRGATTRTTRVRNGEASATYVDSKGHPYVPLSATMRINAGDVVYAGTVVYQGATGPGQKTFIRDERGAAAKWAQTNIPRFAPHLQTKLLPPPVAAIN